jgi:hypothetical protein
MVKEGLLDNGLPGSQDWAMKHLSKSEEIDKERGVIMRRMALGQRRAKTG